MKTKRKTFLKVFAILTAALMLFSLTACKASGANTSSSAVATDTAYNGWDSGWSGEAAMPEAPAVSEETAWDDYEMEAIAGGAESLTMDIPADGRKIIRTAYLDIESKDFETSLLHPQGGHRCERLCGELRAVHPQL